MPTTPGLSRKYPDCSLPPRKFALVISCVDCRLLDDLVRFLDHDNLNNRYYHVTFAGASIGLTSKPPAYTPNCGPTPNHKCLPLDFAQWKRMLYDHVELVLKLTRGDLTDIYIVEHADCGAYKAFLNVDYYEDPTAPHEKAERKEHSNRAHALAGELLEWFSTECVKNLTADLRGLVKTEEREAIHPPIIRGFMMDLRGNVERLFDPTIHTAAKKGKQKVDSDGEAYV